MTANHRPRPIPALDLSRVPAEDAASSDDDVPPMLEVELTEVDRGPTTDRPSPGGEEAAPHPLPPARVRELLERLPPPPEGAGEAPPVGRLTPGAGPSEPQGPDAPGATRVLSVSPRGESELVPYVTVVFSEPMVPLGVDEARPSDLPVELQPAVPGRWRWLDVRTLRFEPEAGRLPGATAFELIASPGARTSSGAELEIGTPHSFRTAGVRILGGHPHVDTGVTEREPVLFVVVDQDIDPAEAARRAELHVDGEATVPLRRVDRESLEALLARADAGAGSDQAAEDSGRAEAAGAAEDARRLLRIADEVGSARWLALRPVRPLPAGADATLRFRPTLPSAEGPLPSGRGQALRFSVRGPLTVTESACPEADRRCSPAGSWWVRLSNPIASEVARRIEALDLSEGGRDSTLIAIRPSAGPTRLRVRGDQIDVRAGFRPHTRYEIALAPEIEDAFGQSLEEEEPLEAHFGGVRPSVSIPGAPFVALDPALHDTVRVRTIGHRELAFTLYALEPEMWGSFLEALDLRTGRLPEEPREPETSERGDATRGARSAESEAWRPSGDPVARWTVPLEDDGIDFAELPVDLSPALADGDHALLLVEGRPREDTAEVATQDRPGFLRRPTGDGPLAVWVQSSTFSLGGAWGEERFVGWAMELEDEAPAAGVELSLGDRSAVTGGDGLVSLPFPDSRAAVVVGRRGGEVAILPGPGGGILRDRALLDRPLVVSVTDRGVYQPGEALEAHGWIRRLEGSPPDFALPTDVDSVRYRVRHGSNELLGEGTVPVGPAGDFHLRTTLPADTETGRGLLELEIPAGAEGDAPWSQRGSPFRIAEFRRPEYEVTLDVEPGPHVAEDAITASISASYFDGGPLRDAPVRWSVQVAPNLFWSAPGWSGWIFGGRQTMGRRIDEAYSGRAGHDGTHAVQVEPSDPSEPVPVRLRLSAEVEDVNRQAGSDARWLLVHPAAVAPALRVEQRWIALGEEIAFEAAAVDLDGAPADRAELEVRAFRDFPGEPEDSVRPRPEVPVDCGPGEEARVGGHTVRPLFCRARPERPGRISIEVVARDAAGRASRTLSSVFVDRPAYGVDPYRRDPTLELVPDRTLYRPGDTARVRVDAPEAPLRGLLTVSRAGLRSARIVDFDGETRTVEIPIGAEDVAGLQVELRLAGRFRGNAALRGSTTLEVDAGERRLTVGIDPASDTVAPGEEVEITVRATRRDGGPAAGAIVALWGVDEAILGLTNRAKPDPLDEFLARSRGRRAEQRLPHQWVLWAPRPPGPGRVVAKVVDAATGYPAAGVTVTVEGVEGRWTVSGERLVMTGIPEGEHRLRFTTSDGAVEERVIRVGPEGVDLGTVAIFAQPSITVAGMSASTLDRLAVTGRIAAQRRDVGDLPPAIEIPQPPGGADPIGLRTDFRPLAFFEERVVLDEAGQATVRVRFPDTMTRYRLQAVAALGPTHFGLGEDVLTVNRPLVVRATPPRILRPGDRPELPATVHNRSTGPLDVDVVARAPELGLERAEGVGARIELDVGERREVRFPAVAGRTGKPVLDVLAVGGPVRSSAGGDADADPAKAAADPEEGPASADGEHADAVRLSVPVDIPRAPRSLAVHEEIEGPAAALALPLEVPDDAAPGFGTVEVGLSTTRLQPLVDVMAELCVTPLPWPGATAARVFGLSALNPVLDDLRGAGLPDPETLRRRTEVDVERLERWLRPFTLARSDDAGAWDGADHGFLSPLEVVHAVHALAVAERSSAGPPSQPIRTARMYGGWVWSVWSRERERLAELAGPPSGWQQAAAAYALHVAAWLDEVPAGDRPRDPRLEAAPAPDTVRAWLQALVPAELPVEALAWLLRPAERYAPDSGLADRLLAELENRALTTGATATFRQGERETATGASSDLARLVLASSRRADAAALAALLERVPDHPLVPGLVRGLLGQRDGRPASGAHENGWVLHALGRYARVREGAGGRDSGRRVVPSAAADAPRAETPEAAPAAHTVRAFLGDRPLGEATLTAEESTAVLETPLPPAGTRADLRVERVGAADGATGPLFVRASVRYSPAVTPETGPVDRGFLVSRRYEGVDDPDDVRRMDDGSWRIRPGARVRVRLTITAPARRFQVQLSDPVPGGLEVINPRLSGTGFASDPAPPAAVDPPRPVLSAALASTSRSPLYGWDWTEILFRWRSHFFGWETHRELLDDGMEAYTPFLPAGTYETSYLVRATTPGIFLAPPPRVEETEHPETFGQAGADVIVVR